MVPRRSLFAPLWVCALTYLLGACEPSNPSAPVEPAGDGSAPADAGADAETGAETDAGTDSAMDAAGDAAKDGRMDAQVGDDAAPFVCEVTAPRACPEPAPSYADVEPIFEERCVPCHDGLGEHWPLNSYRHVADWYDTIRAMMLACGMPPLDSGMAMPTGERELILTWIRCDYPE